MAYNLCLSERDGLDSFLDSVDTLPPTPGLMIKLIALFRQPDRDVDEIVELMRHDVSVTTELLRRCNSSFFGNDEPVVDVTEAVFRLGFYEVYRITVALFGAKTVSMAKAADCIEVEAVWRHSVLTAIAGGTVARALGESEGGVFTAGLLHDIGKIVLASADPSRYAELLRKHEHPGDGLFEAEREALGFHHGEVGARLLSRWGMPEQISVPVLCHHQDSWSGPFKEPAAIVSLANRMARCIEAAPDKPCELSGGAEAMNLLGLADEQMPELESAVREDIKRLATLFVFSP